MSIQDRIEDSLFLWENNRREGAFLSVLTAVAATARRRYPDRKKIGDREAFEKFVSTASSVRILGVEFRGELHSIERILYKWLRCELVHEGGVPVDIRFTNNGDPRSRGIRAGGAPEYVLELTEGWFHFLISIVVSAEENESDFAIA